MNFSSISDMFVQVTDKYDDKNLYHYKDNNSWLGISGSKIRSSVESLSYGLRSLGVNVGDKVAIMSNNSPYWALSDYGIICSNSVTVSIYPTLIANQVEYILNDSGAKLIFVEDAMQLDKVNGIWENSKSLNHVVVLNDSYDGEDDRILNFNDLLIKGDNYKSKCDMKFIDMVKLSKLDSVLTLIYTSGTTGNPKGVVLTHGNLISNMEGIYKTQNFSDKDVFLSILPLSHVFERMGGHFTSFSNGCATYYAESIETVGENLAEVSPTYVLCVPRLFEKMYAKILGGLKNAPKIRQKIFWWGMGVGKKVFNLKISDKSVPPLLSFKHSIANKLVFSKVKTKLGGKLKHFISGGAPLPQEIAEFFAYAGIIILEGYGLTETSPVLTNNTPNEFKFGTVGKQLHNVQIKIGDDGEILAKGPNIMQGYFNKDEETNEVIDQDGWFHTGDIGMLDDDGYLRITDRKKSIIVTSGGKNIAPAPLENAILLSSYVEQVVVLGDKRNFISALIVPSFDAINSYLNDRSITLDGNEAIIEHAEVLELINGEVESAMKSFSQYERVKKFVLSPRLLTIENGELTPKMSIVRKVVLSNFSDLIDTMYDSEIVQNDNI